MLTKTKIVLAAALFAATSSVAMAQFDPNLANRYPAYADPGAQAARTTTLQSAPVRLHQGHSAGLTSRSVGLTNNANAPAAQPSEFDVDRFDRASSPYAGGN
jgi:hypothetical protein